MDLTEKQWAIVEWLRLKLIPAVVGETYAVKNEVKRLDLREGHRGDVLIVVEIGRIHDEGTAAAILCREVFHYNITKRGACRRLDSHVLYKGHPSHTYYKARTKTEAKAIAKIRREARRANV